VKAALNIVVKISFYRGGDVLSKATTIRFSERTVLHGLIYFLYLIQQF
jgi:hypothetical protein